MRSVRPFQIVTGRYLSPVRSKVSYVSRRALFAALGLPGRGEREDAKGRRRERPGRRREVRQPRVICSGKNERDGPIPPCSLLRSSPPPPPPLPLPSRPRSRSLLPSHSHSAPVPDLLARELSSYGRYYSPRLVDPSAVRAPPRESSSRMRDRRRPGRRAA